MAAGVPENVSGWSYERTLGSGGFGAVYLYRSKTTGRAVAIKQCRQSSDVSEKNKSRWCQECDIMLRLNHPNVVQGIELPDELKCLITSDMPVLAMEYCQLGDLRRVLLRPENCCGLPERQVRHVAHDTAAAVEYLHSRRIIHRDLKPENIVMQDDENGQILYKLIDLGYAKDVTQDSICTSFVGTLQYLAPELFAPGNPKYTCTVDYWSLGTTIFECITGMRPFLPHLPPVRWLGVVGNKRPEHIHAFLMDSGKLEYSDKLPTPNQLCSLTQAYFEQWLRMMLLWEPKGRGQKTPSQPQADRQRPYCFEFLDQILATTLLHVYSVPTNEVLALPVTEGQLSSLSLKIQSALHVDRSDQELLTPTGAAADLNTDISQYCLNQTEHSDEGVIDLYLFSKNATQFPALPHHRKCRPLPRQMQIMIENRDMDHVYNDQVDVCKHVVYHCVQMKKDISRMTDAQRAAEVCLLSEKRELSELLVVLREQLSNLLAKTDFYSSCIETDLSELLNQQKTSGTFSQKMYDSWSQRRCEIHENMHCKEEVQRIEQMNADCYLQIQELEHCISSRALPSSQLHNTHEQARKLYEHLHRMPQEQRHKAALTPDILSCIEDCVAVSNKVMDDVHSNICKVTRCKMAVIELKCKVEALLAKMSHLNDEVMQSQRQRQKEIWRLLALIASEVTKERLVNQLVAGDECQQNHDSDTHSCTTAGHLSVTSLLEDVESSDLQFHSIHLTNRLTELVQDLSVDHQLEMTTFSRDWSFLDV